MSRFVFGPAIGSVELVAPAPAGPDGPAPAARTDVAVAFAGSTPEGVFKFNVPAYSAATSNTLLAIHVSLFSHAADGTPAVVPTDPAEAVKAPLHYSVSTAALQSGGVVAVDATEAPVGKFTALAVLEFDQ